MHIDRANTTIDMDRHPRYGADTRLNREYKTR